jgi:crotonobetainyl-CoA:carnitine CoA-transferase CaiB-like acyl-CoA transferase
MMNLPLHGVRVLDLSRVLAGPWCAMVLGDLGADVIKVEHPTRGDDTRDWGARVGQTETVYFNSANRNKRSITVNLQTPEGQHIVRELVKQSDVLIQNFKAGGLEKMGLGFERLRALKPELIYCSISGYDRSGPEACRPGYDLVIQGEAGLMSINGEPAHPPLKFGIAAVDMFTGMYSAQAVLGALYERERTGQGRHIEMALYDCGLMISAYYGLEALQLQKDPPRYGNGHPSIVPYGVFDSADGPLVITVGNNAQFERFVLEVLERPDLAEDARFKTNGGRSENRDDLLAAVKPELRRRPRAWLLQRLADAGIPCGEVLGLHEAMGSERTRHGQLLHTYSHPVGGPTQVMAPPYRFDGERLPVRCPPPVLGEGTSDVLRELLNLEDADIQGLRRAGAL